MFGTLALTAFLASTSLLVRADAVPSVPGPGVVYKVGGTCHIEWDGDADSLTAWKDMAIELMTGDNFDMVHLTTVATGLDGTAAGSFDHICPSVAPNAPIYFYQFSAPAAANKTWTTRFTIASSTGVSVPAANDKQPRTGAAIPWGVGSLTDPSTAVAAPSFDATSDPAVNSITSASTVPPVSPTVILSTSSTITPVVTPTGSRITTILTSSTTSATPASANSTNTSTTKDNAATSFGVDSRVWKAAVALGASSMAFAFIL